MLNVGVFFGSRSPEHDVSIITGTLIISGLKQLGHNVVPIYISKTGEWFIGEELGSIEFFRDSQRGRKLKGLGGYTIDLGKSSGRLVFRKAGLTNKEVVIDLAFPAFHGANGEDGTIQGLFEMFNIPYVGCDVTSSAITMDKVLTKQIYIEKDIPTAKYLTFKKSKWEKDKEEVSNKIKTELKWPLFIKPARLGSSIGIAKVNDNKDLEFAVDVASHYDEKILVEESVENLMDITCAILGNDKPQTSLLQESAFGKDLFSYEDKYLKGGGAQLGEAKESLHIPARLDDQTTKEIRDMSVKIFKLFGCSGIARVDFLYNKEEKKFYANEINTLPGTLYHHLWKASGVSFEELLKKLIEFAKERHARKKEVTHTFDSEILDKAKSNKLKLRGITE